MDEIFKRIQAVLIKDYNLSSETITQQSKLRVDLGLDSLDLTEAILAIEDEFDFEFDEDVVDELQTIEDMCRYISENK